MTALAIAQLVGRFLGGNLWRTLALALLAFALGQTIHAHHLRADLKLCRANGETLAATVRDATSKAQAADLEHALTVERRNTQIQQEKAVELQGQLSAARAAAARYGSLHAAPPANPGSRDRTGVPEASATPAGIDAASAGTVVPQRDLDACAVDYTVARGWQEWWKAVSQAQAVADGPERATPGS